MLSLLALAAIQVATTPREDCGPPRRPPAGFEDAAEAYTCWGNCVVRQTDGESRPGETPRDFANRAVAACHSEVGRYREAMIVSLRVDHVEAAAAAARAELLVTDIRANMVRRAEAQLWSRRPLPPALR